MSWKRKWSWGALPWATGLVALAALAAGLLDRSGSAADWLEWRRTEIGKGQWWRIASGHLVHWNPAHLAWDWIAFAVLGAMAEGRSRGRTVWALGLCAGFCHVGLWWGSGFESYRGLSGMATALAAFLLMDEAASAWGRKRWFRLGAVVLGGGALAGKLCWEVCSSQAVFSGSLGSDVEVAVVAHVAGIAAGGVARVVGRSLSGRARFLPSFSG